MALRYDALTLVSGNPDNTTVGAMGDITYLLQWHQADQPDDYEMNRNNVIYTWQINRNPFIDIPELADYVFGDKQGDAFQVTTTLNAPQKPVSGKIFPNPVTDQINLIGVESSGVLSVYDYSGRLIMENEYKGSPINVSTLDTGIYVYHINTLSGNRYSGKFLKQSAN